MSILFPEWLKNHDWGNISRRKLILWWLGWVFSHTIFARVHSLLIIEGIEKWFIATTEEYQESYLLSLSPEQQEKLIGLIEKYLPDIYQNYIHTNLLGHMLRIGYTGLYLRNLPLPSPTIAKNTISIEDILLPSENHLRTVAIGNSPYRIVFPKNFQGKSLEPFDIISPENQAIVINGSYGIYDGERCREYTINGIATNRFLKLSHGDYIELSSIPSTRTALSIDSKMEATSQFTMPKSKIGNDGIPLCSQIARELGESTGRPFSHGNSALDSLRLYARAIPKFSKLENIPKEYMFADVFMKSNKHPTYWHRAFAFRSQESWNFIDPFSHKQIVPAEQYRRKNDIIAIVAFK